MAHKMRVQYAGAIYHVMSRGDSRESIFLDDVDRQDFLKTLAETCQKTGFEIHAKCNQAIARSVYASLARRLVEGANAICSLNSPAPNSSPFPQALRLLGTSAL